ncbi:MAG: riboflavin synthase [Phycisphaerales bacterium]|nr:riboflavin synthase [Phycisphaerales bacterium]
MFTGLVESSRPVTAVDDRAGLRRLTVDLGFADAQRGDSIAINGVCLTVVELRGDSAVFEVVPETLDRTNLSRLRTGELVHVERALRVGDRLNGHFVQGHVDGTAALLEKRSEGADVRLRLQVPEELSQFLSEKGSVCLDGVSLTIAALAEAWFEVAVIPSTLAVTQLGSREPGYPFNLECDMLAKLVVRWLRSRASCSSRR